MARIRSIKPEFWSSEENMECSPIARLLFIGLWNFCDDAGRKALSPKTIKAEVFPGDDFSVDDVRRMLDELAANNRISYYVVDGKEYLYVTGWKHQKIDRPQKPKCPPPDGPGSTIIRRSFDDHSPLIGEDRKGEDRNPTNQPPSPEPRAQSPDATPSGGPDLLGQVDQLLEIARADHLRTRLQQQFKFQAQAVEQLKAILDTGADFDRDVMPAVREAAKQPNYKPDDVGSISYFAPIVARRRTKPVQPAKEPGDVFWLGRKVHPFHTRFVSYLMAWKLGTWLEDQWGPPPFAPGCQVPEWMLANEVAA